METGNLVEAVRCFQKAAQIKPEYGEAHEDLGIVQKSLKDLDAVEINLRKAVALNPGLVTPYCNLKLILKGQNKQDEAFSCLEEALIIDPNYHTAQHYLNSMTGTTSKTAKRICSGRVLTPMPKLSRKSWLIV